MQGWAVPAGGDNDEGSLEFSTRRPEYEFRVWGPTRPTTVVPVKYHLVFFSFRRFSYSFYIRLASVVRPILISVGKTLRNLTDRRSNLHEAGSAETVQKLYPHRLNLKATLNISLED